MNDSIAQVLVNQATKIISELKQIRLELEKLREVAEQRDLQKQDTAQ